MKLRRWWDKWRYRKITKKQPGQEMFLVALPWRAKERVCEHDPSAELRAVKRTCFGCGGEVLANSETLSRFDEEPKFICGGCVVDAHDRLGEALGESRFIPSGNMSKQDREFGEWVTKEGNAVLLNTLRKNRDFYKASETKVASPFSSKGPVN